MKCDIDINNSQVDAWQLISVNMDHQRFVEIQP